MGEPRFPGWHALYLFNVRVFVASTVGNANPILNDLVATGADAFDLDYLTDAGRARAALSDRALFIGNIDPSGVLALGTPELVAKNKKSYTGQALRPLLNGRH